ncbi:probable inactive serine/threonine-protein kinase slob2 isoform X1 [Daphnia pulex]|uniref:probable inactive serine/threonine-protein kinase slob2 isoform X1 n=1 Tax=Daphnia pulex TaxID=6669 RepID=UPI001EDCB975|nr:probable inactive serine/threonine-protein kinase slob2 isoform X1 [Daphnia pulex]
MFNMYRRRFYNAKASAMNGGSSEELGHDRFNYMNPNVNYDKWPRRLRPKKNSLKVELEAPESPHMPEADGSGRESSTFAEVRHCNGSLREHQRLLNLRSSRHKCSPRCRVKSPKSSTQNLSTEALVKVFACLGVQESGAAGCNGSSAAASTSSGCVIDRDKLKGCQLKRPKRLSVFSSSLSSIRYSSRTKDCSSNGSTGVGSVLDGEEMVGIPGGSSGSGAMSGGAECIELLELERRMPRARGSDIRELATNICRQYIRSSSRYHLLDHLKDIGSRIDKQWFMIRDSSLKTERLLTIVPLSGSPAYGCEVTTTDADATRNALIDLFTALQHPYIYPVLDVDFVYGAVASSNSPFCEEAKPVLVTVFPFNTKGSLKDLIYRSRWQDDWDQKYCQRSEGLPLLQVQRLGRQILEALLFLQERGFPPFGHLHSGNVIIQNGVARLTGFENTLLGFSSRIHPMVKSILPATPAVSIDTICFGHVLFEMCSGYELYAPKPTARHLEDLHSYPQVIEVLDYIFNNPSEEYPTIASLAILEFFRNIDLREMRCSTIYYNAKLTSAALSLLDQVQQKRRRKEKPASKQLKRHQYPPSPSSKLDLISSTAEASSSSRRQAQVHSVGNENPPKEVQPDEENEIELTNSPQQHKMPPLLLNRKSHNEQKLEVNQKEEANTNSRSDLPRSESIRSNLTLNLGNSSQSGQQPNKVRSRPTITTSRTTPSLSMISSLISLEAFRANKEKRQQSSGTFSANVQAQKNFYESNDSFQTPLESPCAEPENYFNGESAEQQPLLVLTSPDNEALSIED